jgi:hypothetical protein
LKSSPGTEAWFSLRASAPLREKDVFQRIGNPLTAISLVLTV